MDTTARDADTRLVFGSPAFWVGTILLITWGLAIVFVFKLHGPCDGGSLCELALLYWLLIGIVPGAYLIAGLFAPPRPFLTGLSLAAVQIVVAVVTALIPDYPVASGGIDVGGLIVVGFAAGLMLGIVVTGVIGHITRWLRLRLRPRGRAGSPS